MDTSKYKQCFNGLDPDWKKIIFQTPDIKASLQEGFNQITAENIDILCPAYPDILNAFKYKYSDIRVVIIGQDPYPGINNGIRDADGLCFSSRSRKTPASLRNIFSALIESNLIKGYSSNNLTTWASQGVLMLNTLLTTLAGAPKSHPKWINFTINIIKYINNNPPNCSVIFLLWGADAKRFEELVDTDTNIVLTYTHPSPLADSALLPEYRFKHCNHFKRVNDILANEMGVDRIDWNPVANDPVANDPVANDPVANGSNTERDTDLSKYVKVKLFTDGSCSGNGTPKAVAGYGFCFNDMLPELKNKSFYGRVLDRKILPDGTFDLSDTKDANDSSDNNTIIHATNQRAEGLAIIRGLEMLLALDYKNMDIELVTDSEFYKNMIDIWLPRWVKTDTIKLKKNPDLVSYLSTVLKKIYKSHRLTITHVRSHISYENAPTDPVGLENWKMNNLVDNVAHLGNSLNKFDTRVYEHTR